MDSRRTLGQIYLEETKELDKAKEQFKQTKTMLAAYEKYFGKYPFYSDGYKLVECPHTGMEHQSCIAYGNHYLGGYRGRSSSEVGLKFDFIIIHESAHEWWGNSVTMADIADMWIHESFGAYAESLCPWVGCWVAGLRTGPPTSRSAAGAGRRGWYVPRGKGPRARPQAQGSRCLGKGA